MPAVSQAQQRYFGAIKGGEIPRPQGLSDKVVGEFARTARKGLPERVKPMADGRSGMTNTGFQQSEAVRNAGPGSRPEWMERITVTKTPTALADGKWAAQAFAGNKGGLHRATDTPEGKPIPTYRVRAAADSKNGHVRHMAQAAINVDPSRYGK